jgi:hypothetical protein
MNCLPRCLGFCSAAAAAFVIVASSLTVLSAQNPGLGEVARKEQERRKALPSAAKVYTNKDLPTPPPRPEGVSAPQAPEQGPVEAQPAAAPAQDAPKSAAAEEEAWKKRMSDAREQLRRSEMFAQALQTRVNSLTNDVLSRDDYAQKARLASDRKDAIAELARVKQEVERGRKQIADIEEEARKAGVPPGWLR